MITISEPNASTIVIRMEGEVSADDTRTYTKALEDTFARGTPCGIVWISPLHAAPTREAQKMQTAWIKDHKEQIGKFCRGFAWVLESPTQLLLYKPMLALWGKHMMGCPTAAFSTLDAAQQWVRTQLG